jgi:hypothetical protein
MNMIEQAEHYSLQYDDDGYYVRDSDKHKGTSRAVHLEQHYVFKAVKKQRAWKQNRAEWDYYTSTTDEIRRHLCKPLYIARNSRVIVMERIVPIDEDSRPYRRALAKIKEQLELLMDQSAYRTLMFDVDYNEFNWGWRNNQIVLMDYGGLHLLLGFRYNPDVEVLDFGLRLRHTMGILSL